MFLLCLELWEFLISRTLQFRCSRGISARDAKIVEGFGAGMPDCFKLQANGLHSHRMLNGQGLWDFHCGGCPEELETRRGSGVGVMSWTVPSAAQTYSSPALGHLCHDLEAGKGGQ